MKSPKVLNKPHKTPPTECVITLVGSRTPAAAYKLIQLTQGKYAKVDPEHYDWLRKYNWYAHKHKDSNTYYAWSSKSIRGKHKIVVMHRLIMSAKEGEEFDHRNQDGLDNRKQNLRKCTSSQNKANVKKPKCRNESQSIYKGVCWHKPSSKWRAEITCKKKHYWLGVFDSELEAAETYDKRAKELFGEFACINFQ